ncbi:MAG: fibronectin type III domain-containing protein [Bacteroidales bacterium]
MNIYNFESSSNTWTPISEGNLVFDGSVENAILKDDFASLSFNNSKISKKAITDIGFPIGFDFTYGRLSMNRFAISSNGVIFLGKDSIQSIGDNIKNGFKNNTIGSYYLNILGVMPSFKESYGLPSTQIRYQTTGVSPHRILCVQFTNVGYDLGYTSNKPRKIDSVSFQIKLYETTHKIEFVFGSYFNHFSSTNINCGLKGNMCTDLHLRSMQFANSTQTAKNGSMLWSSTNFPDTGLTYTFTPPPICNTPLQEPSNLTLQQSSIDIKATFKSSADAEYYLVLQTTESSLSEFPINKTLYQRGDYIGNAKVLYWMQDTTFVATDLKPGTTYYYYVYAANADCSEGPLYAAKSIQSFAKTLPAAAKSLTIEKVGFDSIVLSGETAANNSNMLVLMTRKPMKINTKTIMAGDFGNPVYNLNVGDYTDSGAQVIYKGNSFSNKVISKLNPNTIYHFAAFSLNDTDSTCSSVFAQADTMTYGQVPYNIDFDFMPIELCPYTWTYQGSKVPVISPGRQEKSNINWNVGSNSNRLENTLTTSWIKMSDVYENRMLFSYNISVVKKYPAPYNDWDNDSLQFQYSENGIDFITFFTIDSSNNDFMFSINYYANKRFLIEGVKGKTIQLRLCWTTSKSTILFIDPIQIEEVHECDYPLHVQIIDSTITGSQASVKWDAVNNENLWNIRYRKIGDMEWSNSITANTNPYLVNTLLPQSQLEIQVQAQCISGEHSLWSLASEPFQSGYVVPFIEDFTNNPLYWKRAKGIFADTVSSILTNNNSETWSLGKWKNDLSNKAMVASLTNTAAKPLHAWFYSPIINLGNGQVHYQLEFDAAIVQKRSEVSPDSISKTTTFSVVISTDSGKTLLKTNTLKTYDSTKNSLLEIGDSTHIILDLTPYIGNIQIGFYAYTAGGEQSELEIDNIAILPTCPSPKNVTISEIESTQAKLTFESLDQSKEYIVGIRPKNNEDSSYTYQVLNNNTYLFFNLLPLTNYQVSLTSLCSIRDTAAWVVVEFMTPSNIYCAYPDTITVNSITKTTAKLNWSGMAQKYILKYKEKLEPQWHTIENIISKAYQFENLNKGTVYQYTLQSVCSEAPSDTSSWTQIDTFATVNSSCFAPTQLVASNLTNHSVNISWSGLASEYQLAYKLEKQNEWTMIICNENKHILENLNPRTKYKVKVRAICAIEDSSTWSEIVDIITLAKPICDVPTNLRSSEISPTSVKLTWDTQSTNLGWTLYYRTINMPAWDTVKGLKVANCRLENLLSNTVYLWSVQGHCEQDCSSAWANQTEFTTEAVSIEQEGLQGLKIFADQGQIHILNLSKICIEKVEIFNTQGQRIQNHVIKSTDNIIINTNEVSIIRVIKIYDNNAKSSSFKLFIK